LKQLGLKMRLLFLKLFLEWSMDVHTKDSKKMQPILITRHWNYCDTQWVPRLVPTGYPGIPPGIMIFYGVQRALGWGIPEITSPRP